MVARIILVVIGLIEVVMPKRVARFWVSLFCKNPDEVELRRWLTTGIRLEGLLLLGIAAWLSRDTLSDVRDSAGVPSDFEVGEEVASVDTDPVIEEREEATVLRPDTTRFTIAAALYHAEEPMAVSDLVDLAENTEWEVGRSTASATLYRMYRDDLVDRREREDGRGYVYWLADEGQEALEAADAPIEPNPFQEAE